MVDTLSVERRRPPLDAMNLIALAKQKLCEVSPILSGDAGNQCPFQSVPLSKSILLFASVAVWHTGQLAADRTTASHIWSTT